MGATNFSIFGFGKTIKEAFANTKEQLDEEIGHQDGYSGQLNSKHTWREVPVPEGVKPLKLAKWIETAAETLSESDQKEKDRLMKSIPKEYHYKALSWACIYDDKYGAALVIKVTGKPAKDYREQNRLKGKKGGVYYFCGFAPC